MGGSYENIEYAVNDSREGLTLQLVGWVQGLSTPHRKNQ
jgi:hypothetical protein